MKNYRQQGIMHHTIRDTVHMPGRCVAIKKEPL